MTHDEFTNDQLTTNDELHLFVIRSFVIDSSFWFRHSKLKIVWHAFAQLKHA